MRGAKRATEATCRPYTQIYEHGTSGRSSDDAPASAAARQSARPEQRRAEHKAAGQG
eukprot:COSAG01_NODE_39266_length_478_cov_44.873351_2_plen_56_part_01